MLLLENLQNKVRRMKQSLEQKKQLMVIKQDKYLMPSSRVVTPRPIMGREKRGGKSTFRICIKYLEYQ